MTTTSVPGRRWIQNGLEEQITWARMSFKPVKSRYLVLKKGKTVDKYHFNIGGTRIPSISEKPVKSLEKDFDRSLRDTASTRGTNQELEAWLVAKVVESWLRHIALLGTVIRGRAGLGRSTKPHKGEGQEGHY